jgi:NAD(P)-dependent dehydrogenase (short-subunit alcohol dehydrogenase family)
MRVVIVGGAGLIGSAIAKELGSRHEIVVVGRKSGTIQMDSTDAASIRAGFQKIGKFDALVSAAGNVKFAPLAQMQAADYEFGLKDKVMGQVNLVLIGREFANDNGSFTLTSGILGHDPIVAGSSASMTNCALDAFVRAAAIELPRGLRINVVSPTVLTESMKDYGPFFRGYKPVPAVDVALAYSKSVEGAQTGQVYRVV